MQQHDEEQISQLRELGLNAYEARAYLTLLGKESFTATQIAGYSGVPRQRIYDILARLIDRGLIINRPNRLGARYAAIPPKSALEALLHTEQQRLIELENTTTRLIERLGHIYTQGQEETSPLDYIEVLRGQTAINQRFAAIQKNCQREILIFTKPPYARPPQENLEGLEALKRDVVARSVYEYSALDNADVRAAIYMFMQQGEQARFVAELPLKLVIVDESLVLFVMEDPLAGRTELTIMVIENTQLAKTLKLAFEAVWSTSETFDAACQRIQP